MHPIFYISSVASLIFLTAIIFLVYKGVRVKKKQFCPANQWTTIIFNYGTGMPRTFNITFKTKDEKPVNGEYSEHKYLWIFGIPPKKGKLEPSMTFHRNWINGMYKLKIFPATHVDVFID